MMQVGFHIGQRIDVSQRQTLAQRQQLRLGQTVRLVETEFDLIAAVTGTTYREDAPCPTCGHNLTKLEVLQGFVTDPFDVRTTCPKCGTRFEARLTSTNRYGSMTIAFYCPTQTTTALRMRRQLCELSPEELEQKDRSLYMSAKIHFGTLKEAFRIAGLQYSFAEKVPWREKVKPFLGELPDGTIAKHAGVSRSSVVTLRHKLGVPAYRASKNKE